MRNFGLDVLRASAILSVLSLHCTHAVPTIPPDWARVLSYGWIGVDLFFVLSGYLIASQVMALEEKAGGLPALGEFWVRRWTRTLPLYFVVLFVYVVVKPRVFAAPFLGWNWRFLVFLQNQIELEDFIQSWSLCIEEQFYLAFPLIFLFFPRLARNAGLWLIPALFSLALRVDFAWGHGVAALPFDEVFRFRTPYHLDGISVGVFLAATSSRWKSWSPLLRRCLGVGGALGLIGILGEFASEPQGWDAVFFFTVLSWSFGLLLIGMEGLSERPPGGIWIEWIALVSYGAYLWNNLLIRWFLHHPLPIPIALQAMAFVLSSFALAWITYVLVERPGMKLRGALGASSKSPVSRRDSRRPRLDSRG